MRGAAQKGARRIAIVDGRRCKPTKCNQECVRVCPVVRTGHACIEIEMERGGEEGPQGGVARIAEDLCVGCGMCTKKCPFSAIRIFNLPRETPEDIVHQYGPNQFRLYRAPLPRRRGVLGMVGANGTGKSTALHILAGRTKPNLGRYAPSDVPSWTEVLRHFRGSPLQSHLEGVVHSGTAVWTKPQYVDVLPRVFQRRPTRTVRGLLEARNERGVLHPAVRAMDLEHLLDRDVTVLSGGELQRFAVACTLCRNAGMYVFDEPSSFLDIRQRVHTARAIRGLVEEGSRVFCEGARVVVVEHDLAMLDVVADTVCCLYGEAGAYGIVSGVYGVGEGLNAYLAGYLPAENVRFREAPLRFQRPPASGGPAPAPGADAVTYPDCRLSRGTSFHLCVKGAALRRGEVVAVLGQNGTGKTTFLQWLGGRLAADDGTSRLCPPHVRVVHKPQSLTVRDTHASRTVRTALAPLPRAMAYGTALGLAPLLDHTVGTLSGGELQRLSLAVNLAKEAGVYLVDEPSAHLDSEQRIAVARLMQRHAEETGSTVVLVEHDLMLATAIASRVIVFQGDPGRGATASAPGPVREGMNAFMAQLGITVRCDPVSGRPRVNKPGSDKDTAQRRRGVHWETERTKDKTP